MATRNREYYVLPGITAAIVLAIGYLGTYDHPAGAAGLYLSIVEQIQATAGFPTIIPHYDPGGIPFAYPPLTFYLTAKLSSVFDVSVLTVSHYLPPLLVVVLAVPMYYFFRELATAQIAAVATIAVLLSPTYYELYLTSGGIVRTPAAILTLTGLWAAVNTFKNQNPQHLALATVLFGLVVLSHLVSALFFGLTCLILYGVYDRSRRGILYGTTIAVGGLLIAAPWWLTVIQNHGIDVFIYAASSRSSSLRLYSLIDFFSSTNGQFIDLFKVLGVLGALYAVFECEYQWPVWLGAMIFIIGIDRYIWLVAAFIGSIFLFRVIIPQVKQNGQAVAGVVMVVAVCAFAVGSGLLYATDMAGQSSHSIKVAVGDDERTAMAWARNNTAENETFWVQAHLYVIDWWPMMTDRTVVLSPLGSEWEDSYQAEHRLYRGSIDCTTADCLESVMDHRQSPDYIYVDKNDFPALASSLRQHQESYQVVYETESIAIYETLR